jgi:hypothetical protein
MDGAVFGALAKTKRPAIREGIAALITHKVLQLSNNKKSGLLSFSGKPGPLQQFSGFSGIWEREPLPLSYNCN